MSEGVAGFASLRTSELLKSIDEPAWQDLQRELVYRAYRPGEPLLVVGQRATQIIFLLSGVCREYFLTLSGEEYNKAFVGAGSVTGSLFDLLSGEVSTASIEAIKPVTAALLDFDKMKLLRKKHSSLDQLHHQQVEMLFIKKSRREHQLLTLDGAQRYQKFLSDYPGLEQEIPLYHIASFLGMTPESLSRIRKNFALM